MTRTARIGAAIAATALTFGLAAPAAQAQTNAFELIKVVNQGVENVDCNTLGAALKGFNLVDENTTRKELVTDLNKAVGDDAALKLIAGGTINAIGDRALECKIVKADQLTPVEQAVQMSSQLSSQAGLPEARLLAPLFEALV